MLSYNTLSKKPLLFRSFTGLDVKEFDNIYDKEIEKRYHKHELKRLSKRKNRKKVRCRRQTFQTRYKKQIFNAFSILSSVITYTLTGFLFDLDQRSNVCRDIQKIESLIRKGVPIPQKIYNITKRLKTLEEVEEYFPGLMAITDCTEQQIPRPEDKRRRKHTIL